MANVTIRNLDDEVMERIRERARRHHRSVEAELRDIITRTVKPVDIEAFKARAAAIRARTAGRQQSDSTDLVREDRDR
jgi:plasmid stability protein